MVYQFSVPVLNILRGIKEQDIEPIADIIISCGMNCIEITMNTPMAAKLIKKVKAYGGSKLVVGAGTVLTLEDLSIALEAGASFIVTPGMNREVMECCTKNNIDIYPGALTPTEIQMAWDMGATMVKVFPSSVFGPKYIKELKGPYDKIKLMAVGGVTIDNVQEFFKNGVSAVAVGGSIFKKELLENGDYEKIKINLKQLVNKSISANR